jgi:hypothetical protein
MNISPEDIWMEPDDEVEDPLEPVEKIEQPPPVE